MADKIKVPEDAGPYEATLSLGRFPFDWELWDYAPSGAGWSKLKVGAGSNFCKLRLPEAARAELAGHVLVWSVMLVDLDTDVHATELTVGLVGPKLAATPVKATFDASPDRPHLFVSVQVEA